MPSPFISSSPSVNAKPTDSSTSVTKTKRLVRRRGRGRGDMSDEEFEREALTDSSNSQLTSDSGSDSEKEEPPANSSSPSNTFSAGRSEFMRSSAPSPTLKSVFNGHEPTIPPSTDWSDMVTADETDATNLPVVDFNDLGKLAADTNVATQDSPSTSALTHAQLKAAKQKAKRKAKKEKLKALSSGAGTAPGPSSPPSTAQGDVNNLLPEEEPASPPSVAESKPLTALSQHPPRSFKPNPRQAYLERLTNDPSYVPRVGAFWGHDDRLMDKELRSMSPWWRGRGRGGRGRGGTYTPTGRDLGFNERDGFVSGRARGRGFSPRPHQNIRSDASPHPGSSAHSREASISRAPQEDTDVTLSPSPSSRGHWSEARGGRGGVRGRGTTRGRGRAGAPAQVAPRVRDSSSAPRSTGQGHKPASRPGKKTERAWTKPLDESLIANAAGANPKRHTRQNSCAAPPSPVPSDVRIKLPGTSSPTSVHINTENTDARGQTTMRLSSDGGAEQRSNTPSGAEKSKPAIVKLPIRQKIRIGAPVAAAASAAAKSAEHARSPLAVEIKLPPHSDVAVPDASVGIAEEQGGQSTDKDPFIVRMPPDEDRANIVRQTLSTSAVSSSPPPSQRLPTSFSPPGSLSRPESAAPPPFAPAYIAPQTPHLPPGVGYTDNGILFELATGRPVILAPPQPGPPMFQPPPRLPYVAPFTNTHEFHLTPPAGTPPPLSVPFGVNGYPSADLPRRSPYPPETTPVDASAPIFVPARSTAVEIRAPSVDGESPGSKSSTGTTASSLSTSTSTASSAAAKPPKQSVKTSSNLRTSVSALTEPDISDAAPPATKEGSATPQPPFVPQPYAHSPYYYPGPDYAVYAPVPIGVDGQPQYGVFYSDAQYAVPSYSDPNPYAAYGTVYYGPGPYSAPVPGSSEGEVPRFY